jgi:putative membrane protein
MSNTDAAPQTTTQLAIERTRLAYDRTLMAWIRTSTSLITFGFSVYKFFQIEMDRERPANGYSIGPRGFALLLVSAGLIALILATIDHRRATKFLWTPQGQTPSLARLLAAFIGVIGLVALIAVFFRE